MSNDPQSAVSNMSHSQAMAMTSLQAFEPLQNAQMPSAFRDRLLSASPSVAEDEDLLGQWSERLPTGCHDSLLQLSEYFTGFPPDGSMTGRLSNSHSPIQKHPAPEGPKACNCFDFLLQTLHVMQTKSLNPHSLALDNILSDSKNMIRRGEALLDCSCSENGTLIMLLASLVAEHLSFLQAATAANPADSGSPTTTNTTIGSTTASTSNSENQAAASYASRLTIGNYIVDREDEARLRIEMILMELQKTNAFLAKFKAKVARLQVGYERQTYEGLVNLLCTRLREATIRLQKQKVNMNGDDGAE